MTSLFVNVTTIYYFISYLILYPNSKEDLCSNDKLIKYKNILLISITMFMNISIIHMINLVDTIIKTGSNVEKINIPTYILIINIILGIIHVIFDYISSKDTNNKNRRDKFILSSIISLLLNIIIFNYI